MGEKPFMRPRRWLIKCYFQAFAEILKMNELLLRWSNSQESSSLSTATSQAAVESLLTTCSIIRLRSNLVPWKQHKEQLSQSRVAITKIKFKIFYDSGLDGNGQLFLCLQDLNIKGNFIEGKFEEAKETSLTRKRSMIIVSDEEWDILSLKSAFGGKTGDRSHVLTAVEFLKWTIFKDSECEQGKLRSLSNYRKT